MGRCAKAPDAGRRPCDGAPMSDEHTDVPVSGPALIEIDAERIAQIIFDNCHTSERREARI